MTQIDTGLYKTIADNYADTYDQLQLATDGTDAALNGLVDVTTGGYGPGVAAAVEIELALLGPLNTSNVFMNGLVASISTLLDGVRAVNNHVINNTSGSASATDKLRVWVDNTMSGVWTNGIPCGWHNLSTLAGYNTTGWSSNNPSLCP